MFILKAVGKLGSPHTVSRECVSDECFYRKDKRDLASTYMDSHWFRHNAILFPQTPLDLTEVTTARLLRNKGERNSSPVAVGVVRLSNH